MKIKVRIIECTHESKYGVDTYARIVKKEENVEDIIEEIKSECDYDENGYNEYFDYEIKEEVINTDDFEEVEE